MAKRKSSKRKNVSKNKRTAQKNGTYSYCSLPDVPERTFEPGVSSHRISLIRASAQKWVNGTELTYYFFDKASDGEYVYFNDGTSEWRKWTTTTAEKDVVRKAFDIWKKVGIGLEFKEVKSRTEADIRIGFMRGDGAWSYIGRDILDIGTDERTMNFGWDLTRSSDEIDTAVHEIGHSLGFPHEHQNPNAGIVWDKEAVYAALAGPPNYWSHEKTDINIINKIRADTVQGSNWDPNSIMHYPFEAGLIKEPAEYRNGLYPEAGLSERDKTWVKTFYPSLTQKDYQELKPYSSIVLDIAAGQQMNFYLKPTYTRTYNLGTFGTSDTVIVLFENVNGELKYCKGDDDSGWDRNALITTKLFQNHVYVLRVRLFYTNRSGETIVLWW